MSDPYAIAYHESAHALTYLAFEFPFNYVSIEPTDRSLGHIRGWVHDTDIRYPVICLAGIIAEHRITGARWDRLVSGSGRQDVKLAEDALSRQQRPPDLSTLVRFTHALVDAAWPGIEVVAQELMRQRRLQYDQVVSLCASLQCRRAA